MSSVDILNVIDFGAVGDGVTDDTVAIQSAIDAAFDYGKGAVYFPYTEGMDDAAHYKLTAALIVKPGVSLIGDVRKPKIKNLTNAVTLGLGEVLLAGNFHPDFTEEVTIYPCGTIAPGTSVTLTNSAD